MVGNSAKSARKRNLSKKDIGLSVPSGTCDAEGNTKASQCNKAISWFFTFNNYRSDSAELLNSKFNELCNKFVFEEESGTECETPHLQGVIWLKEKMRWTELKLPKEIHWEITKKSDKAEAYCQKEFHWKNSNIWYKGITLKKPFMPIMSSWVVWIENEFLEHKKGFTTGLSKWQKRSIYWLWSDKGGLGKTEFQHYFIDKHKANIIVGYATNRNIQNLAFHAPHKEIFIINATLETADKLNYSGIEILKDGILNDMKSYKNGQCHFQRPFIIVFANSPPAGEKLMSDRYFIRKINFADELKK